MRLFKMDTYGEAFVLALSDDVELTEKVWIGGSKLFKLKKADLEAYLKAEAEADEEEEELYLHEWLQANDKEYRYWIDEYASKQALQVKEDEVLFDVSFDVQDANDYDYDLIYSHYDGHNWKDIVVVDKENGCAYEVTEDYPELAKIESFKGQYNQDGEWMEYKTGTFLLYKDSNDNFYIIDLSFYNGSLCYIEPISLEELQERFNFVPEEQEA